MTKTFLSDGHSDYACSVAFPRGMATILSMIFCCSLFHMEHREAVIKKVVNLRAAFELEERNNPVSEQYCGEAGYIPPVQEAHAIKYSDLFVRVNNFYLLISELSIGSKTLKVVPIPTSLLTAISPPIWTMVSLQIASPKPAPPLE